MPDMAARLAGGVAPGGVNAPAEVAPVAAIVSAVSSPSTVAVPPVRVPKMMFGLRVNGSDRVAVSLVRASPPIVPEMIRSRPAAFGGSSSFRPEIEVRLFACRTGTGTG